MSTVTRPGILLFGHDGQIGGQLFSRLSELGNVTGVSYPQVDFADGDRVRRLVRDAAPDLIVNAAAYTAVDKAESDLDAAVAANTTGPQVLAEEATRLDACLVHYSTDFVFDGAQSVPYTEEDQPRPISVYGRTKWEGDRAVMRLGGKYLIFRVSWIYGLKGKNFLLTMQRLGRERREVRVVNDQVGSPTWCASVAEATTKVLKGIFAQDDWRATCEKKSGVYHMTCSGQTSWHGFARAILPPDVDVVPIPTEAYPTPACRPAYSVLDCGKLRRTFGIDMPDWRETLTACLDSGQGNAE